MSVDTQQPDALREEAHPKAREALTDAFFWDTDVRITRFNAEMVHAREGVARGDLQARADGTHFDNLPQPAVLVADRGYDSDKIREDIESRNALPMIPMRKNRKVRKAVDMTIYTLRNMVERCFNRLKNSRRLATRYDKTAESFLGFVDLACIRLWLRHLST